MKTAGLAALAIGALGAVLGGCAVGPDYHRPTVPVPPRYAALAGWTAAQPEDAAPKGDWWTAFHDPLLDRLEPEVAVSNQTVRQAAANYQQAIEEMRIARSALLPAIGVAGSATRSRSTRGGGGSGPVVDSGSLEGVASWSVDLWGGLRRELEQSRAIAAADQAQLANATLAEQTLLATTVIDLRVVDADIALERRTVRAYRDSLRVVTQQAAAGVSAAPPSAVITARTALDNEQAALIALGVSRAQYLHAIAVLVGRNPEDLAIPAADRLPALPAVPPGVPSTLLERRPDIAAAERTVAAENAAVGVATAAYFPSLSLAAADGFAQSPLDGLLHTANDVWSLGANSALSLIDFGARRAQVRAARAAYQGAVANYRNTVLNAFAHVEDDLASLRILAAQAAALNLAVTDAARGAAIALAEFQAGTVDYTTVAQAQATLLADQRSALAVRESRLVTTVALIGDLGGGWSATALRDKSR